MPVLWRVVPFGGDVKYVNELSSVQIGGYAIGGNSNSKILKLSGANFQT
jgi:hypothetical protein